MEIYISFTCLSTTSLLQITIWFPSSFSDCWKSKVNLTLFTKILPPLGSVWFQGPSLQIWGPARGKDALSSRRWSRDHESPRSTLFLAANYPHIRKKVFWLFRESSDFTYFYFQQRAFASYIKNGTALVHLCNADHIHIKIKWHRGGILC